MWVFECSSVQTKPIIYSGRVRGRCRSHVGVVLWLQLIENHPWTMKCFVISDFGEISISNQNMIAGVGV